MSTTLVLSRPADCLDPRLGDTPCVSYKVVRGSVVRFVSYTAPNGDWRGLIRAELARWGWHLNSDVAIPDLAVGESFECVLADTIDNV